MLRFLGSIGAILSVLGVMFFLGAKCAYSEDINVIWSYPQAELDNIAGFRVFVHADGCVFDYDMPDWDSERDNPEDPKSLRGSIDDLIDGVTYFFVCRAFRENGVESLDSKPYRYTAGNLTPYPDIETTDSEGNPVMVIYHNQKLSLDGGASSDWDGEVVSWSWEKTAGPSLIMRHTTDHSAVNLGQIF